MIHSAFIAYGSNLWLDKNSPPKVLLARAIAHLCENSDIELIERSRYYRSAPVPPSNQPWYVNGILLVKTKLSPEQLLAYMLEVETFFGRIRGRKNAARTLDFDLIAYDNIVLNKERLILPHPRMHLRAFVLCPMAEIAPQWCHPKLNKSIRQLIDALQEDEKDCQPILNDEPPS